MNDVCVIERALGLPDAPVVAWLEQPMLPGEEPLYFPMCIRDARKAEESIASRRGSTSQRLVSAPPQTVPASDSEALG